MFRSALLLSVLMVSVSYPALAHDIVADSKIKSATVYTNRATLTRQAVVDIAAGAHTITFSNLPADLLPDSLRVDGSAVTPVKFGALTSKMVNSAELAAPREKELNDQLLTLQDQRRGVEAEKAALTAKQTFLDTLSKQGALRTQEDIAEIKLNAEGWAAAAATIYTSTADIAKAQLAADVSLRDIDNKIAAVQGEIDQLETGARSAYQVTVPYEATADAKLTINLSYQVPNATWEPLYDARLDTKSGQLELTQYGAVRQNTGEDWTDVALTLSTAQPSRGAGLPDLNTFWINLFQPQDYSATTIQRGNFGFAGKGAAQESMMAMDSVASAAPAAAPAPVQAQLVTAQIETGGFVSEYKIPGPSTVAADGTISKLMVGAFKTESKLQVQVKPQLSTDAFLVARTTLLGEAPILPGGVSLFRDGAYVGQAPLPLLRPGEERDLAFGIDDQVAVKRRIMKDQRSDSGTLSITRELTQERQFVTDIQNLHSQPVEVQVLETIPVAQNKDIRVEIMAEHTTPDYLLDADKVKGQLKWTLPLKPQDKAAVKLGWKVSWPKDQNISGL